jgi:hypothetical protein
MAIQPAPMQFGVVTDAGTYTEIEHVLDAPTILKAKIDEWTRQREQAVKDLWNSIGKDVKTTGLATDGAIESILAKYKAGQTNDEKSAEKIRLAEEGLLPILEEQIEALKAMQPGPLRAALCRKLEALQAKAKQGTDQAKLLTKEIQLVESLLSDLEPCDYETPKSKKK